MQTDESNSPGYVTALCILGYIYYVVMWYSILLFLYRRVAVVVITVGYGKQRTVRSGPRRATTSDACSGALCCDVLRQGQHSKGTVQHSRVFLALWQGYLLRVESATNQLRIR